MELFFFFLYKRNLGSVLGLLLYNRGDKVVNNNAEKRELLPEYS